MPQQALFVLVLGLAFDKAQQILVGADQHIAFGIEILKTLRAHARTASQAGYDDQMITRFSARVTFASR